MPAKSFWAFAAAVFSKPVIHGLMNFIFAFYCALLRLKKILPKFDASVLEK
jgi:hypothetical protein